MPNTFFRLVSTNPPTTDDFLSLKALNRKLKNPGLARISEGVTVWDTRAGAESLLGIVKNGNMVAELRIPDGSGLPIEQTMKPGHFTIWAEPDILLDLVVCVHAISSPHKEP